MRQRRWVAMATDSHLHRDERPPARTWRRTSSLDRRAKELGPMLRGSGTCVVDHLLSGRPLSELWSWQAFGL